MNVSIVGLIILPIFLLIVVACLALQVFLSMQKSKWLGLILPIINVAFALMASFGNMVYTGEIAPVIMVFILLSIPAVINVVIYLACRAKVKAKSNNELQKMNIQDLD
jgi:predicted RND superfamily exporter protein